MGVWGVDSGSCREDLLKPLGLVSYSGKLILMVCIILF